MKAKCMNSVPRPDATNTGDNSQRVFCGWKGEISRVEGMPCPRCSKVGVLAPVIAIKFEEDLEDNT